MMLLRQGCPLSPDENFDDDFELICKVFSTVFCSDLLNFPNDSVVYTDLMICIRGWDLVIPSWHLRKGLMFSPLVFTPEFWDSTVYCPSDLQYFDIAVDLFAAVKRLAKEEGAYVFLLLLFSESSALLFT